jgi:hypothetical protein
MTIIVNITPVPVQSFTIRALATPETYILVPGVQNQQIQIQSYTVSSSAGTVQIGDTTGAVFCTLQGQASSGTNGLFRLPIGAGLAAIVSDTTNIDCTFVGFIA